MSDVEVLYEGVLSLCRSPSKSSRDWTQRLFVLKLHRDTNTTMLDYYKDKKKRWQKQDTVGVIPLFPSFRLSLAHECGYKFPLKLVVSGQIYYLSATDFRSMNAWFHHIQLSQVLGKPKKGCYEYEVLVKPSESTGLIEARGTCLLALTANNEIVCASFPRRQILGVWPYDSLRGYWCKEQAFGFEAGRRSPRGEGIFEFITDKKENIYRHLETAIMRLKQGDTRPPLPSPDSDTPPVSTSSSDTEATPPPPLPPPPTKTLQKAGSVRTLPPSAAPAANLRRVNTHTGVKKWLNDTYNPDSPSNTRRSLSPLSGDDTYSHTVHPFPQPRHTTTPDPPGLTYQRLHGHDASRHSLNLNSQGVHNLAEEDMRTYDVAFPGATARPLPLLPDNEYSVLGAPDPSRVAPPINNPPQRVAPPINNPPQRVAPPINNPPKASSTTVTLVPMPTVQNDTQLDDAEMTDNPMYDSQDDILKAIEKMSGAQVTPPLQHRVLEPPLSQLAVGGICPVYESHTLDRDTTPKAEQNDPLEPTEVVATEDPSQESKPVKPYSKVKKKKPSPLPHPESGTEERGSDGGSPPPLPARLYSMDSSNSDPPNNDS